MLVLFITCKQTVSCVSFSKDLKSNASKDFTIYIVTYALNAAITVFFTVKLLKFMKKKVSLLSLLSTRT